jgi:carbon storage regulator
LTRKLNATVTIGDDVVVTVLEIRDGRVRLGISAPADWPVHRGEIYDRIRAETHQDRIGPRPVPPEAPKGETP